MCIFKEIHKKGDGYTEFQSVYNPEWKLGFNKRGSPLKGDFYMRENGKLRKKYLECLRFTKREFEPYVQPGPSKPKSYSPWDTAQLGKLFPRRHPRHRPHVLNGEVTPRRRPRVIQGKVIPS